MLRNQIYFILTAGIILSCQSQKVTMVRTGESYEDGSIKWRKEVKKTQNSHSELGSNFMRTRTEYWSYYPNGKLFMHWKRVEDLGSEISCHETLFELTEFFENGKKSRWYKTQCDCHKEFEKTYNEKGKLLTTKKAVKKRLY